MKRLVSAIFAIAILAVNGAAFSITDPFYMPEKAQLTGDLALGFTNRDLQLLDSFSINGYLQAGINEKLSIGLFFGWARVEHESRGFQDPSVTAKFRILDGLNEGLYLDVDAFLSPEVFESFWNNKDGAAKGATDLGVSFKIGSTEMLNNFTLYAGTGFRHFGHTDFRSSGTAWDFFTGAKYYGNEKNSFELAFHVTSYLGLDRDRFGVGFDFNYAYEFEPNRAAIIPYYGAERHNHNFPATTHWGVKTRYLF